MINHYISRSSGTSSKNITGAYWGTDEKYAKTIINVDFTNAKGSVIGWFNGHIHKDTISTDLFDKLPMFSITTAGGDLRDEYLTNGTLTRVKGTPTETAIDLVTITSDYIYFTRIGSGYDRKYNRLTKEVTIDYDSAYKPPTEESPKPPEPPVEEEPSNLFDINGDGYVAWDGSKMYTNWIPYRQCTTVGDGTSTIYHFKGGTPYKFRFRYGTSETMTSLAYCTNANSKPLITSDYDSDVKLLQHDWIDGNSQKYIQFEFREDCASNLIIQADKPIGDNSELTQGENLAIPNPTNTTDTSIWVNGYRFSSSKLVVQEGTSVSNKIQIKKGDTIKISGVTLRESQDRLCVNISIGDIGEKVDTLGYFNNGVIIGGSKLMSYKGYEDGVYTFFVDGDHTGTINSFRFAMPTPTNFSKVKVIREEVNSVK